MDITVQREALLKPLQSISAVVEKKQTRPVLANVLLAMEEDNLLLTGTDLEIELVGTVQINTVDKKGATTVSARKLFDICRTLPEGAMIRLYLEDNCLVVRTERSCFKLNTLPCDAFPHLETCHYPVQLTFKQSIFKQLLTQTYFAMGQQDVRPYLNGIYLDIGPHGLRCVAADGHRLALAALQDEHIGNVSAQAILPRKSVLELVRLLGGDNDTNMTLSLNDNRLRVVAPDLIFTTKLINAKYPDYNRLIPQGTIAAFADREAIKQALVRASVLLNEKFRGIRFQLTPNELRITANNSDQEQAEEALPLQYDGPHMEIGFNVAYLLDAVSAMTAKTIRCVFTGQNDGMLIGPAEQDQSLYVVMPMRF